MKENFKFCYPLMEKKLEALIKKSASLRNEKNKLIEVRIDYLLSGGESIEDIYRVLHTVKNFNKDSKIIATIRNENEGGMIKLSKSVYERYISILLTNISVDYVDIEYNMYKNNKIAFDKLIKTNNKKIIISSHLFDKVYNEKKYKKLFDESLKSKCDIVKFAIMTHNAKETVNFMETSRIHSELLKKHKKDGIFIAMGQIGIISRVYPEFTNTKIVFANAYDKKANKLGQLDKKTFNKYRKILEKSLKTC